MPNREIRAGWLSSETVNQLRPEGEVFFLRLCLNADDYGRFTANPILLRSALYPLKDDVRTTDVSRYLAACEKAGLVRCYTHDHKPYLEITKFAQRLRAMKSKFPAPPAQADTEQLPGISLTEAAQKPAKSGHKPDHGPAHVGQMPVARPVQDRPPRSESESESESNKQPQPPGKPAGRSAPPAGFGPSHPLFAALATVDGADPWALTPSHRGRICKACGEILSATPGADEQEVNRRAAEYPRVMPRGAKLTAMALATNWAKCAGPAPRKPAAIDTEPAGWRATLAELYPGNAVSGDPERTWTSVDADTRAKVIAHQKRNGRAA